MNKKCRYIISAVLLAFPFALIAEPVRQAATDGMTISLGNYTQQIKVRAKALGPGNCNVDFTIQGKTIVVVAPPKAYSEWIAVGPTFFEPAETKLGVAVKCDAGAITQVSYHK